MLRKLIIVTHSDADAEISGFVDHIEARVKEAGGEVEVLDLKKPEDMQAAPKKVTAVPALFCQSNLDHESTEIRIGTCQTALVDKWLGERALI